jgi:hypothetical protein
MFGRVGKIKVRCSAHLVRKHGHFLLMSLESLKRSELALYLLVFLIALQRNTFSEPR